MRLGIDFGTTRTIVSVVDRGNYPVVSFEDQHGDSVDHFPSVAALVEGRLVFGFDALAAARAGAPLVRSFKRALAAGSVRPDATVRVGEADVPLADLVTGFLRALREALASASTLADVDPEAPLEAMVAVPAHAHSAQRLLTLDAFAAAGFTVVGLLNEPSAAAFEYTHRQARTLNARRTRVVVYDLGGGTFDASLVQVADLAHEVESSLGINRLGGDDLDAVLADLARAAAGDPVLDAAGSTALLDEARAAKESLSPQSRRIPLRVGTTDVVVDVDDFYAAAAPLIARTVEALEPLLGSADAAGLEAAQVAGLYLVGGSSELPLVARELRARFGRRVKRSPHAAASTAIGLAIAADPESGFRLTDRLSRGFGVFRDADAGAQLAFDPLIRRDQRTSPDAEVTVTRRYRAAHNLGVFRFVEHARLGASGEPTGDVVPLEPVFFPFDRTLRDAADPAGIPVVRTGEGPLIQEEYRVDARGVITATLTDLEDGYSVTRRLGTSA
ncbi:Hsp70 family protein [Propioniciclava coleopterorum]|uniref:Hsp70 family protein n=1 Tax=Propioniciclava coleopterorum TaxID=2714937 RepID=A0A6G7Y9Y5_9ACTN|nr:Hsp70 family protein [Propioniciclava coleopterorum]QIK73458.1 Hsp70 family protein [Propioniciclava coleopterorum]